MVEKAIPPETDAIVFRSSGRWSHCKPAVPYFVYLDAVVRTFVENTFDESDFIAPDLERIYSGEAAFLESAAGVFFESAWGLERAVSSYGLKGHHYHEAGVGGAVEPPESDAWDGTNLDLVTIAMNFRQKGGDVVRDAYVSLKSRFPSLTWRIIGGSPDAATAALPGVSYEGVLHRDVPADRLRMSSILSNAFLLVHPTREDVNPLVVAEAAYYGCPAISVREFAIPELIDDGRTGLLVGPPPDSGEVARAIESLLLDGTRYSTMRHEARENSLTRFSWKRTGAVICDTIASVIGS
jgi:glycosyltransferase involved in cell wall biosynthesis